jgi:deazaflavin-dependent oxidoreductase (nitroreductase family)
LPIYLYCLNLGWLFGHRGLLPIHQGRKSGLLRETVLEVALYDPDSQGSVALSAWGEKADWYRNIEATPTSGVRTGGQRYVAEQRFLTPEENHAAILEYAQRHPLAFRVFVKAFGFGDPLKGLEDERPKYAESLRVVAIRSGRQTNERGPPGGQTNTTQREVVR